MNRAATTEISDRLSTDAPPPDPVQAENGADRQVAVVMRTRNCDWVVHQALASLFAQEHRAFELVVVDSGSTDATLDIVSAYPHRLLRVPDGAYQPGPVLNRALATLRHEIVVFWNSDAVALGPDVLGRLVGAFADPAVHAAFARQLPRPEAHGWVRRDYAASFPPQGRPPPWITLSLVVSALRRATWERHPFHTRTWASEDTEWGAWALREGLGIRYVADARVMHSHNYTLSQIYGRMFVEGEADAFIHGARHGLGAAAQRAAAAALRDIRWCLRGRDVAGALAAPLRRGVAQWAYWRGRSLGAARLARGDADAGLGAQVVLARHESNRE